VFPQSIEELIHFNLLPDDRLLSIENLYLNERAPREEKPSNLDGVLISHPHKDHFKGLSFINRAIPIYGGEITRRIIWAFYEASPPGLENNFKGLKWNTFRTGDVLNIKGLKIVPYHVDHSIPAAYGFIVYSSIGPIVYSGDFRMHGPLSYMTHDFVEQIHSNELYLASEQEQDNKESKFEPEQKVHQLLQIQRVHQPSELISDGVKVLICEGTKISKGQVESEHHVKENLEKLFHNNPFDYALVQYDRIDWDRFRTFSHIAKEHGWKYIINEQDAYFYHIINKDEKYETLRDPNIIEDDHIYILRKGQAKYEWQGKIRQEIYKKHQDDRFLEYGQIKELDKHYFIYITHLDDDLLDNLNYGLNGLFISSNIDPYVEEFYDSTNKINRILLQEGIPGYRIHSSGHANSHDIINFINDVNPRYLIPIHTENTKVFEKFFQNSEIEVKIPELNEKISF
jgi:ribonuclease J